MFFRKNAPGPGICGNEKTGELLCMGKKIVIPFFITALLVVLLSSSFRNNSNYYFAQYKNNISRLRASLANALELSRQTGVNSLQEKQKLVAAINKTRLDLKACDFWLRYMEPVVYKKLNGPLPVEWETEVFEKYEAPYKREGAGLTLAWQYLDRYNPSKDSLSRLLNRSLIAAETYFADSIIQQLNSYHHFFLCNRLYLLNLATIYTTGYECPDPERIIPELKNMLQQTVDIYQAYNSDFPDHVLSDEYISLYHQTIDFVQAQPENFEQFDHFTFISGYINPLFRLNQQLITAYKVRSSSYMDYTLNDEALSVFDKTLFSAQNPKGIYNKIKDKSILSQIDSIGKLLFYDPVLSGNNMRSCASCHKNNNYFADTAATAPHFNRKDFLQRNQPTLLNAVHNHLLMADGRNYTLTDQIKDVVSNPNEMNCSEQEVLEKLMSIPVYKKHLTQFAALVNSREPVSLKHVSSAITLFYGRYSYCYAPFDDAMNSNRKLDEAAIKGFNIFMGKAQCATCHFAPQFSGIKPPYISNEFEVIGTPATPASVTLSTDEGRYSVHAAAEMKHAFRTPTLRNSTVTQPYMHNGSFHTLEEVIDFYDAGGGTGKGIPVPNQTLPADSLHLTPNEKQQLVAFLQSLTEKIPFETPPQSLPLSKRSSLNQRKVGGAY